MPALRCFEVPSALVPVQMAMSDSMVLESTVKQGANDSEALLRRLLRFHLVLLRVDSFLTLLLSLNFAHLDTEAGPGHLGKAQHLHRGLSPHNSFDVAVHRGNLGHYHHAETATCDDGLPLVNQSMLGPLNIRRCGCHREETHPLSCCC